jgi:hypothetical protein
MCVRFSPDVVDAKLGSPAGVHHLSTSHNKIRPGIHPGPKIRNGDMLSVELASLTRTIADGIARRGFFLLMDERVSLLCGDNADPAELARAARFAALHGWEVECAEGKLLFCASRNAGRCMRDTMHLATN